MSFSFLILLISCTISVHGMFKPIGNSYYGGGENCEESKSTTTSGSSTTMKWAYSCMPGWKTFQRTPSDYNDNTGVWCVKFVPATTGNISISKAEILCQQNDGELTAFENENERLEILVEVQTYMINVLKRSSGSIAISGKRSAECNMTGTLPDVCSDNTKSYILPKSSGTNPQFLWNNWVPKEPSFSKWTYDKDDVFKCLFLHPMLLMVMGKLTTFTVILKLLRMNFQTHATGISVLFVDKHQESSQLAHNTWRISYNIY